MTNTNIDTEEDLVNKPIPKLIKIIAWPAAIGFFFNTMYNVVDTWVAGQISGEALAALSLTLPVFFIVIAVSMGIYELPSGTIEQGEDPVTALLGEVEEETGLVITDVLGTVSDFDYTSASGVKKRQITFVVRIQDVSKLRLSDEHDAFMWVNENALIQKEEVDETMIRLCAEALRAF